MVNPKILAIDDNADNIVVLKALMGEAFPEATFTSALSGKSGIEQCRTEKPDVVLLDIVMPGIDGFEVCRILKADETTKTIPVIMVTAARTDKENRIKALEMGADAFLAKPVDESELTAQIRAMLRIKESEDRKLDENERLKRLVEERTIVLQKELEEKRKVEMALRDSEERFQMLFNKAPLGYQSLDFEGNFIEVNQQWLETLGYSRQEVIGKWFGNFLSPEYRDAFRERFPLFKALGQIHSEFEMFHKNGSILFISFEGKVGRNLNGDFVQTHCILQDITEQRKAQLELKESEEKYRRMVELLPDAIIVHQEGKVVFANPAAYRFTGATSPNQLLGRSAIDFVHPDDRAETMARIIKMYETGEPSGFAEEKFITLNHEVIDAEVIGIPINFQGKPAIQTILRDMTKRKQTERSLQEQKNEFETIFNLVPAQIWYKDTHNNILRVNQQVCRDIGLPGQELEGRATRDLFPEFADQYYADDLEVIRSGQPKLGIIEQIKNASGELKWHHTNKVPVFDDQGEATGVIAFALDITESKIAEDELKASRERWGNLFNNSPSAIAVYQVVDDGNDFVFTDFNLTAQKTDNLNHDEVVGKRISQLFPAADDLGLLDVFRRVWRTGKTEYIDSTFYKDNRIEGWRENIIYRLNTREVVAIYNDVSDRKKAEIALRESEQRFRSIFSVSPHAISISDIETGKLVEINEAYEKIYGFERDEIIGKTSFDLGIWVNEADRKVVMDALHKDGSYSNLEIEFRTKNGSAINCLISGSMVLIDGTNYMITLVNDVTLLKNAERAIKESEEKFRSIFENHSAIKLFIDPETGEIVDANEAAARYYGWSREELKQMKIQQINTLQPKQVFEVMKKVKDQEQTHFEFRHRLKDGSIRDVEVFNSKIEIGGKVYLHAINHDITERKKAEKELLRYNSRLELAMDSANMAWWEMDVQSGSVIFENRKAEMLGYSPDMFKHYTDFTNLIHPEDFDKAMDAMKTHLDMTVDKYEVEYRIKSSDGRYQWFYDIGSVIKRDKNGRPLTVAGLVLNIGQRKQAEEALKEREQLFRSLFNASPDAIVLIDPHHPTVSWPIVDCNEASCLMNGYTREEMIGHSIDVVNTREATPEERKAYLKNLKQKGIVHDEFIHRHKDGHFFPVEDSSSLVTIGGHEFVLGINRDITERKQAELALRESQDRYRSFISQVSEGVYRFECDQSIDITLPVEEQIDLMYDHFSIAECNDAILKMYKLSDETEMMGKGLLDFHGGRNNPLNRETLRAFIRSGYRIENAVTEELNIAGQQMYISNNSLGIVEDNRLVRLWGTQTDITEKVRAEQVQQVLYSISNAALSPIELPELIEFISQEIGKLLDSTNFYIAFYDEKTDLLSTIYERDENDVLQTWPAEGSITGFVIKKQKSMLIKDSDVQKFYEEEGIKLLGTPSKIWLGVPLSMNNKAIGALVVQSYDNPEAYTEKDKLMLEFISNQISISIERKKAEHEIKEALFKAQESDRLKSAFLANMSHEIRTPLNSIIGFSELMTDPDFEVDQQLQFAQMINTSGNNLLLIINDIMDISKIEAGQVLAQKYPVSMNHLIGDIRNEYSYKASEKGLELKLDILNPEEDIRIDSDEVKLRQILINLVGNALKFTREGFVELGFRTTGGFIQFHVKDTGIGIPAEFHNTIFERFRQVEDASTRRYGGNGLGLAISKSLVELLGGKLWLESEPGKGTTFYFTVPR